MRPILLALGLMTLFAVPAWAQEPDPFAVTAPDGKVYGATAAEFDHWTDVAHRSGGSRSAARQQALQLLISYAWLRAEAAERGIVVTHEETVQEFRVQRDQSFPSRRAYRRFLREYGQTTDDVLFRIHADLLSSRIRDQALAAVSVTAADVDAHLAEHGIPRTRERRDLWLVVTRRRSEAVAAKRELRAGAGWKAVAKRYSRNSTHRMRGVPRGHFDRRLQRAVFAARVGRLVGPLRTQFGHYVFSVTRVTPAREIPLARAREQARQLLLSEAQQEALAAFAAAFDAKWSARTICVQRWRSLPSCVS